MIALALLVMISGPMWAAVETTTVSGKVLQSNGSPYTGGTIVATLSAAGSALDGATSQRVAGRYSGTIDPNGAVTGLSLVPNDVITPSGTFYTVAITTTSPTRGSWTEKWSVTTSPDPINIGAITRLDSVPSLVFAMDNLSDVSATAPSDQNILQYVASTKQWTAGSGLADHTSATTGVHGVGALSSVAGTKTVQTLENKTINAGLATVVHPTPSNYVSILRHATDCTAVGDGKDGEFCYERDSDSVWICEDWDEDGRCTDPSEWKQTGGQGIPASIVDVKGDLIAATGPDTVVRLAAGANGTVLEADSSQAAGLRMRYVDWVGWSTLLGFDHHYFSGGTYATLTANLLYCHRLTLPQGTRLQVDDVLTHIGTADGAADLAVCLYDDAGTTKLAGNDSCSTASTGALTCALSYTLTAGSYSFCYSTASATLQIARVTNYPGAGTPSRRITGIIAGANGNCPATIAYPYTTAWGANNVYSLTLEDAP